VAEGQSGPLTVRPNQPHRVVARPGTLDLDTKHGAAEYKVAVPLIPFGISGIDNLRAPDRERFGN
jgi:hypothetical protein